MAKKLEEFSTEIREDLLEGAQQIFVTAFNAASDNGMSEEAAMQVAWNTVKHDYAKGNDGKWRIAKGESGIHGKAVTSGGN